MSETPFFTADESARLAAAGADLAEVAAVAMAAADRHVAAALSDPGNQTIPNAYYSGGTTATTAASCRFVRDLIPKDAR